MTAQTAAMHHHSELRFVGADREIAYFEADSKSRPGRIHTVAFDLVTRQSHCEGDTPACRRGDCWHTSPMLLEAAYLAELARQYVARAATMADVEAIGRAAKGRIAAVGSLWCLASPLDSAILIERE